MKVAAPVVAAAAAPVIRVLLEMVGMAGLLACFEGVGKRKKKKR
jgi:ACR3 family arsenite efflux pump ArsB